jgi:2,3-bisphosphoglycerate-dependent phosphoglycerate mutase
MADALRTLVLIRHGESLWNRENRFTGWVDADLSETGIGEARRAGDLLRTRGYEFDLAFTSVLTRAIRTLHTVLETSGQPWVPVEKSWRLNERHYGGLQGLDKAETAARHGDAQVKVWRRSYDVPPPPIDDAGHATLRADRRYAGVTDAEFPRAECLKDTVARVLPYWDARIAPELRAGKRVLVAAHGNSLRALLKYLQGIPDAEIVELNIPTAEPYELRLACGPHGDLSVVSAGYLDPATAAKAAAAVAAQAQRRPA